MKYKFKPLTSNNKNIDMAAFKNIFAIFLNESPIVHFSLLQVLNNSDSKKNLPYLKNQ